MGEPTARKSDPGEKIPNNTVEIVAQFLRTIFTLSKTINADDVDDSKNTFDSNYNGCSDLNTLIHPIGNDPF